MTYAASVRRFLSPDSLPTPFGYSHVVDASAARLIFVSGQVPLDREGQLVGAGDFEAQARQVFDNLTKALAAADASWADVVKLSYFLTDVNEIGSVRAIRDEYVNTESPPASTLVEVSSLFRDDVLIEIDAVAIAE
ncbi:MAG: RidA family protein [Actinobacteria bacterium]|nr:MAG: RidA family protein [Actinomycetota bacterium]